MSTYSAGSPEPVTISDTGVTLTKSYGSDEFPIPTITFVLRSEHDDPVTVRFVDPVPDDIALEGVGFHPRYGSEHWTVDGNDIIFERQLDSGEEYTTIYGLRGKDIVDPNRLMTQPDLEIEPQPTDTTEKTIEEDSSHEEPAQEHSSEQTTDADEDQFTSQVPEEMIDLEDEFGVSTGPPDIPADEADDSTEFSEEASASPSSQNAQSQEKAAHEHEPPSDSMTDDSTTDETTAESTTPEQTSSTAETETVHISSDQRVTALDGNGSVSIASILAEEIRQGTAESEDLETIVDFIASEDVTSGSTDARISHLQSQVANFEAYIDALESFINEQGDAKTILNDLRTDLRELDGRILTVEDRFQDLESSTDDQFEAVDTEFDTLWDDFTEVESTLADVDRSYSTIESRVESIEDSLAEFESVSESVDSLNDDLTAIRNELDDLTTMKDRLNQVFGPESTD